MRILFVGERKSKTASQRGWSWKDGRLAAKQLFDALDKISIDPKLCEFANAFERGHIGTIRKRVADGWTVIAMGQKAQDRLTIAGISYCPMIHPAARGKIRNKARYARHVKSVITTAMVPTAKEKKACLIRQPR